MIKELIARLDKKNAVIGILGLGYVGIPLMIRYAEVGYKVLGIDIDSLKVKTLNKGESYIMQISSDLIKQSIVKGFEATNDFSRASEVDALILCVPTPLNKHREPDLSFIISTINKVLPYIKKGQVISLESTTYPGTTEEELLPRIESTGLEVGKDFYLVYSPEREDPGNINFTTKTIPKVVGGYTDNCLNVGKALYKSIINQVVPVSSLKIAEMTKLLENIHFITEEYPPFNFLSASIFTFFVFSSLNLFSSSICSLFSINILASSKRTNFSCSAFSIFSL